MIRNRHQFCLCDLVPTAMTLTLKHDGHPMTLTLKHDGHPMITKTHLEYVVVMQANAVQSL